MASLRQVVPDGKWVAYCSRPVDVGRLRGPSCRRNPRRLTFDGRASPAGNLVVAWVLAATKWCSYPTASRSAQNRSRRSLSLSPRPSGQASHGSGWILGLLPDGSSIAYTRTFTSLAARKRYVGGQAEDIYVYETAKSSAPRNRLEGHGHGPNVGWSEPLFLVRPGPGFRMNLWRYSFDTERFEQLTHFADFDIDTPSLGGGRITFQQGGRLWALAWMTPSCVPSPLTCPTIRRARAFGQWMPAPWSRPWTFRVSRISA